MSGTVVTRRPHSRKFRALLLALNTEDQAAIAREWARQPFTHEEIAAEWGRLVGERFPELKILFHRDEVTRFFRAYGERRVGISRAPDGSDR